MALARKPFVVLDSEILSSSVWAEKAHIRLVWITLLILCDTEGNVGAALPGIARAAGVTLEEAEDAMAKLQSPDPYSRTKANEGIRVSVVDRGYRVLNFLEHLDRLSAERKRSRDRVWRHRQRRKETPSNAPETTVTLQSSQGIGTRDQGPEKRDQRTNGPSNQSSSAPKNPMMPAGDRPKRESELLRLVSREAELTDRDPPEVMSEVTGYDGAKRSKLNPASMTDDRLLNSLLDARARVARLEEREVKRGRPTS